MSVQVLIVDDDHVFASMLEMRVVKSGLCAGPLIFPDAETVLTFLDQHHNKEENFLIILDINFNSMNGWQMLDRIKDAHFYDRVSVFIATASVETKDREKAKEYSSIIDYFEKPLEFDTCEKIMRMPEVAALL